MSAQAIEYDSSRRWRVQDLQDIADERHCYEIADGVLEVTPPPTTDHENAAIRLVKTINAQLPGGLGCGMEVGVIIGASFRRPDAAVVRLGCGGGQSLGRRPDDVLLVAEIASPSTRSNDETTKRAEYAAAGIPAYLRIDLTQRSVVLDTLEPGHRVYHLTGVFRPGETIELTEPVPLRIAVDDVLG